MKQHAKKHAKNRIYNYNNNNDNNNSNMFIVLNPKDFRGLLKYPREFGSL